jgi:copper oxidase (laccase) domain-containing protein
MIFDGAVRAAISSKRNGNMKFGIGEDSAVLKNRRHFLEEAGLDIHHTTLVAMTYDTDDFAKYRIVKPSEKGSGMFDMDGVEHADALVVDRPHHALFLPLADCIGMVLYDDEHHVLMVSHVGRHNAEVAGARRSVEYMTEQYASNPAHIKVWLSPGVGKASYPLHTFGDKSLHEVVTGQLTMAGVSEVNIENAGIDTAVSEHYYSHSEYLKGNDESGRFAIVAEMTEQGEPAS